MRIVRFFAALFALGFPSEASAQMLPPVICDGLAGCGGAPVNVLYTSTLPLIIAVLANAAGAAAVIFIVIAGWQMLLGMGDESKMTQARWGVLYAIFGLALAIMSQVLVSFIVTENYGQGTSSDFLFGGFLPAAVRIMVSLFNVVFVIVIMLAGYRMAFGGGKSDEFTKGLNVIKWAIAGAVVTNVAHALVNALLAVNL